MSYARPAHLLVALLGAALLAGAAHAQPATTPPATNPPATNPGATAPAEAPQGSAPASSPAKLELDSRVMDWGVVTDQDALKGQIKFRNTGGSALQITECKPSCGCVRPKVRGDKKTFAPGEEGVLDIEFEPLNKQGPVKDLYITFRTNDPASQAQRIDIKCDVKPTVGIDSPDGLSLGSIDAGSEKSLTFYIFGRLPDFKATFATISAENGFAVKVGPAEEAEFRGEKVHRSAVTVTAQKNAKPGRFTHSVVIRHTDKRIRNGLWELTVTGEVLNDVRATPADLDLGALGMSDDLAFQATLTNTKGAPFKVLSAKFAPTKGGPIELATDTAPGTTPDSLVLKLSGKVPARPGPCEGTLVVTTDVKGMPPVRIPLKLTIRLPQQPTTDGN